MVDLEELERLADAATPGPWFSYEFKYGDVSDEFGSYNIGTGEFETLARVRAGSEEAYQAGKPSDNAAFISMASPKAIKALIAQLKAQADRIEALEAALKPFADEVKAGGWEKMHKHLLDDLLVVAHISEIDEREYTDSEFTARDLINARTAFSKAGGDDE